MFKRILIATDGSELADKAIDQGMQIARGFGAKVYVLRVMAPPSPLVMEGIVVSFPVEEARKQILGQIEAQMQAIEARGSSAGIEVARRTVESDHPWRAIIETAEAESVDLIVMASHGRRGVSALVLGSETYKVLTHTKIPVLVCR